MVNAQAVNAKNSSISAGCWIDTEFGEAVCTSINNEYVEYRYSATRVSDQATIWVANASPRNDVKWLRDSDAVSQSVLTLAGPYGDQ